MKVRIGFMGSAQGPRDRNVNDFWAPYKAADFLTSEAIAINFLRRVLNSEVT
jgi:hypothetical protein